MTGALTIGSLFSGVGGIEIGLERAGLGPVVWQAEVDPFCRVVLEKHWPSTTRYEDVTLMVECLDGPCQDIDMAGKLKKLTIAQAAESVRMYEKGMSLGEIGAYFGVTRQGMHDLLKRRTKMRPQKRYGAANHFYRGGAKSDDAAHDIVEKAVLRGVLERPVACEECSEAGVAYKDGRAPIQAHHDDYNKPLDVRWLCQRCHHQWHRHNEATEKEVPEEVPKVDVICGGFP